MDLNQLLYHHQIAIMNQARARTACELTTCFDLVDYYDKRIRQYRVSRDLPRFPLGH